MGGVEVGWVGWVGWRPSGLEEAEQVNWRMCGLEEGGRVDWRRTDGWTGGGWAGGSEDGGMDRYGRGHEGVMEDRWVGGGRLDWRMARVEEDGVEGQTDELGGGQLGGNVGRRANERLDRQMDKVLPCPVDPPPAADLSSASLQGQAEEDSQPQREDPPAAPGQGPAEGALRDPGGGGVPGGFLQPWVGDGLEFTACPASGGFPVWGRGSPRRNKGALPGDGVLVLCEATSNEVTPHDHV